MLTSALPALFGIEALADDLANLPTALKYAGLAAGVLGPVVATTWGLASRSFRHRLRTLDKQVGHWREVAESAGEAASKAKRDTAAAQLDRDSAVADLQEKVGELHATEKELQATRHDLQLAEQQITDGEQVRARLSAELDTLRREVLVLREKSGMTADELDAKTRSLARLEKRMKAALKLEGQLWNARSLQKRPKFRELGWRKRAIVSVLNLKGGVGKTTLTAHLGTAFARRGYRVLLVDLDLQGSLTSMLLPQEKINQQMADGRLVQHFFNRAAEDKTEKLPDYAVEVLHDEASGGRLDVIGTTDKLAYAELNLTMRWLMGTGDRDTRFLLRKSLHLMSVSTAYDLVLIDCPPLVNISCVNALAASDYLLVPTTMSRKSMERVPGLLKRVVRNEQFVKFINPKLQVLGLVANRTFRDDLTQNERADWAQLGAWGKDAYGVDVPRFNTTVPDMKDVRASETEFGATGPSRLTALFDQLAAEVEGGLPHDCRHAAKASS